MFHEYIYIDDLCNKTLQHMHIWDKYAMHKTVYMELNRNKYK